VSFLDCNGKRLDLSRPCVMGILNVTPDSFADGGRYDSLAPALGQAHRMVEQGAAIIDVGGESTRPGAPEVELGDELERVVPVIEALSRELSVPVSVDTSKPEVMRAAVAAGAGLINDVMALRAAGAVEAAAASGVPVCLMHMQGSPRTMQRNPVYGDVVEEVRDFLMQRVAACEAAGIPRSRLMIDPGFGFGKTLEHNLQLLRHLDRLVDTGLPVLVGMSRKSMIGALLDKPVEQRVYGSLAAAVLALQAGASIIRAHDVAPTVDALAIYAGVSALG
jgi:dihydropteroate synthase